MGFSKKNKKKWSGLFGINKKKILFFAVVFVALYAGVNYFSFEKYQADTSAIVSDSSATDLILNIEVLKSGKIKVNNEIIKDQVDLVQNELRLAVVDNPNKYFNKVTINVTLPDAAAQKVGVDGMTFYAIHGVGETNKYVKDMQTLVYEAKDVSPYATLSVVAKLPEGTITPGITDNVGKSLGKIKSQFWLFTAIFLPLLTFFAAMFFLIYQFKRQQIDIPEKETEVPPMAIPPSVVGALYSQKVGSREIAATLVDLAERGDILILDRERGFAFGKGRFDQRLLGFEKMLLSKIFKDNLSSDRREIERRINNHFYSKKMSMVTVGVYALATRLGYFKADPQKSLAKYRLLGIAFFLLALAGFVASIVKFTDPPYIAFFWVGMMISALIISITAGKLPIRTIIGQEVLSNWLAFRKFLCNPSSFPYSETNQQIFQKYLPYAIVLDCEAAWAKRFSDHNFVMPDWFLSEKSGLGLEDFCLSLFPIVSYVGRSLSAIREPGFE